jgi:hypothetical protein
MMHSISKTYGVTKPEAGKHKEIDFWELMAFENLESLKLEYLMKKSLSHPLQRRGE